MGAVKSRPIFSILIPTYKGAEVIGDTLRSILSQDFQDFEIIINEDCSGDNIEEVVKSFDDSRIKYYENYENLGYPGNLESARRKASGEFLYLMGQDDILGKGALEDTYEAFQLSEDIGAVTRPYFWFDEDINKPVRAKEQLNPRENEVVTLDDSLERIIKMFSTLDQLSGLAYRREFVDVPFHPDIFPCHVYPFASIFKRHPVVFLSDYNIAVRIATSQTRHVSSIYDKSPIQTWVDLFKNIYNEARFVEFREKMIREFVAINYVGLIQIRNYAKYKYLLREIFKLIEYRPKNLFHPAFWFFSFGTIVMPPKLLIPLVDFYKSRVNSRFLKNIKFEYELACLNQ
ncbi:glycosyltransferase [candidate division WWE3 bacterium]|nr:glycosyltransferase [candidate division WWE3 bacterium]